jgi:hypothetical protein
MRLKGQKYSKEVTASDQFALKLELQAGLVQATQAATAVCWLTAASKQP